MTGQIIQRPYERWLAYAFLLITGLIMAFPFIYMLMSSLKSSSEVVQVPPRLFPENLQIGNYLEVISIVPLGTQLLNTVIVTGGVVLGWVITSVLAGYAFARLEFPGRDTLFFLYLGTLMVPFAVIIVPMFKIMVAFSWVNRLTALIIPWIFTAYGTFLLRQFFRTIPIELEDAAKIDGCNYARIFWNIMLPLSKPALATLGIFVFLFSWNNFLWPLLVINSLEMKTLPLGLAYFLGQYTIYWNLLMVGATITLLPVLIVFFFAQRYFIEGITLTGLKG